MAYSTKGDTDVQYLGLLVLILITVIAGLLMHSFIIGVNVADWWKGRSVTPVDHIVTSLGISRMGAQCAITIYVYVNILFLDNTDLTIQFITEIVYTFFAFDNFYLTSLLSIVYCLKISNLHSRLFLYLRGIIVHKTGFLIAAIVLLSALNNLIFISMDITPLINGGSYNTTMANLSYCTDNVNILYNYSIGSFIPMLFDCISSVLLFTSLYHHTVKMKLSSNLSINLDTYYSVMRFTSFTLIYNTMYYIGNFACILSYYFYCAHPLWLYIILEFLPALHSSYLIYRTARLRSQMSKILQNVTDFLFQRKDTEIRENIEVVAL